jgi:uncharacterized membrane protein YdjX (TVP38/TMEM64 family)
MTALYLGATALQVAPLEDPRAWLETGGPVAGAAGVLLLVGDALAPIPSSLVLIALGSSFGFGTAFVLGLVGKAGMAALCLAVGRRGVRLLDRVLGPHEQVRARGLVDRWGSMAVLATRPVPLVAETTMLMAGASAMPWRRAMAAAVAGSVPEVAAYSAAGALAPRFASAALIWTSLLGVCALFWIVRYGVQRRARRTRAANEAARREGAGGGGDGAADQSKRTLAKCVVPSASVTASRRHVPAQEGSDSTRRWYRSLPGW